MSAASLDLRHEMAPEAASSLSDSEPEDLAPPKPHETYYFDEGVYDIVFLVSFIQHRS